MALQRLLEITLVAWEFAKPRGLGFQSPLSSAFLTGSNYLHNALMLNNDAANAHCVFVPRCQLLPRGQLTALCTLRPFTGLGPCGTNQTKTVPAFLPTSPPFTLQFSPHLPALSPPASRTPSPHCPSSHWWFLPATEIQETTPHASSAHSFLQGLTHTQLSLIGSSLFSVP